MGFIFFYIFRSFIWTVIVAMMLFTMLMIVYISLISSFRFWFSNNNESIILKFFDLIFSEVSRFRRWWWTWATIVSSFFSLILFIFSLFLIFRLVISSIVVISFSFLTFSMFSILSWLVSSFSSISSMSISVISFLSFGFVLNINWFYWLRSFLFNDWFIFWFCHCLRNRFFNLLSNSFDLYRFWFWNLNFFDNRCLRSNLFNFHFNFFLQNIIYNFFMIIIWISMILLSVFFNIGC